MRFRSQVFWMPKDLGYAREYEDAFEVDEARGAAAIADGVSSAIFSGLWARLLTKSAVDRPPDLQDFPSFAGWLAELRAAWRGEIDPGKLKFYQREKLVDGAMSTLLWLSLLPAADGGQPASDRCRFCSVSIGDSCLFHVRQGQLLRVFPMESSAEFGLDPAVLGSVDRQRDHLLEFEVLEDECLAGDLLVLCTDALGLWGLRRIEAGEPVDWTRYWDMPPAAWQEEICELRAANRMRFDDTTLALLKVVEDGAVPEEQPASEEETFAPVEVVAETLPPEAAGVGAEAAGVPKGDEEGGPTDERTNIS